MMNLKPEFIRPDSNFLFVSRRTLPIGYIGGIEKSKPGFQCASNVPERSTPRTMIYTSLTDRCQAFSSVAVKGCEEGKGKCSAEESLGNTIACMHNVDVEPFFQLYAEDTQWMKIKERSWKVDVRSRGGVRNVDVLGISWLFSPDLLLFSRLLSSHSPVKTTLLTPFSPRIQF